MVTTAKALATDMGKILNLLFDSTFLLADG